MDLNYILCHAVRTKQTDITQILIDKGANVNHIDLDQKSALYNAYEFRQLDQISILCQNNADINKKYNNATLLMLEFARSEPNEELIKLLLDNGANPNVPTILHRACDCDYNNNSSLLLLLLSCSTIMIDLQNDGGETALQYECRRGNIKSINLLLEHGADINVQGVYGRTALMLSIISFHHKVTLLLLSQKNIKINLCDKKGMTALHHACKNSNMCAISLLLSFGADVTIKNNEGIDALHCNNCDAIECLFLRNAAIKNDAIKPKNIPEHIYSKLDLDNIPYLKAINNCTSPHKLCHNVGNAYQIWCGTTWSEWFMLPHNFKADVEYAPEKILYHFDEKNNIRVRFNFIVEVPNQVGYFRDTYL